ncbi:MAG: 16S rRNA (guanine(527)-N(7))-methyltransferase RsmG [Bacilli bacterium]
MNIIEFKNDLENINVFLTDKQLSKFEIYYDFLVQENEKYNLTAINNKREVFYKHFYDSIAISSFYEFDNQRICDVGSGAGFPSIPLKIVYENLDVVIVDALGKRINFLNQLCNKLDLNDVECVHARAEEYASVARESFDCVTARAVAALPILCELCIPLVKQNGIFFVPKGSMGHEEKDDAANALKILGCSEVSSFSYSLPYNYGERTCFTFKKINKTPKKYPRNFGQIKKRPL